MGENHTVGQSSFGRGIYAIDTEHVNTTDNRFLDRDGRFWDLEKGEYVDDSPYRYLAPMIQLKGSNPNANVIMRNIRNDRSRGVSIDRMIECVVRNDQRDDYANDCSVISSFIVSNNQDAAAYIYHPILPKDSYTVRLFSRNIMRCTVQHFLSHSFFSTS